MIRLFLYIVLLLAVISAIAIIGYAYLGDMSPAQSELSKPVILDVEN